MELCDQCTLLGETWHFAYTHCRREVERVTLIINEVLK